MVQLEYNIKAMMVQLIYSLLIMPLLVNLSK